MIETIYHLVDYCDEVVPCECTLAGWAEWLSKPDEMWGRSYAARDGEEFTATTIEILADVLATFTGGQWVTPQTPLYATSFAIRHGYGLGWDVDTIDNDLGRMHANAEAGDLLPSREGDTRLVACWRDGATVRLRFDELGPDGPTMTLLGPVN